MIHDLRFIEREVVVTPELSDDGGFFKCLETVIIQRILQAHDGYVWFDIPMVSAPIDKDR